jgi:hypothetical protein
MSIFLNNSTLIPSPDSQDASYGSYKAGSGSPSEKIRLA